MGFFGTRYKNAPWVVNWCATQKGVKNYHIGKIENPKEQSHLSQPAGNGVRRRQVWMKPRDKVKSGSVDMLPISIRADHYLSFGPGEVSPRAGVYLLPDRFSDLPENIKRDPTMGLVMSKFYQNKGIERGLKLKAETEPELIDKLKFTSNPTQLDDAQLQAWSSMMDRVERAIEVTGNKKSSGSGQD